MVVRFEVDGCFTAPTPAGTEEVDTPRTPPTEDNARAAEVALRSDLVSDMAMHESAESPARQSFTAKDEEARGEGGSTTPPPEDLSWDFPEDTAVWGVTADTAQDEDGSGMTGELTVVRSGTLLPQSSILELATRSIRFADRTSTKDTYLQLFLTQTPTHVVAIHENGNFEKVVRQELASAEFIQIAEKEGIKKSVAQFVELLEEIQCLVKEHGTKGRLSLVCEKGKLELFGLGEEEGRLSDGELERFKASASTTFLAAP